MQEQENIPVERLYSDTPIEVPLSDIYTLPGISYYKESADSFSPLLQSVCKDGIKVPIKLIPRIEGGYYLVEGYRRCHAAVCAHIRTIPATVENMTVGQGLRRHLASNMLTGDNDVQAQKRVYIPSGYQPRPIVSIIKKIFCLDRRKDYKPKDR